MVGLMTHLKLRHTLPVCQLWHFFCFCVQNIYRRRNWGNSASQTVRCHYK